jgi:hypothetical protein
MTHVYIHLLRMPDTMTSQNIDLSSRDTLYILLYNDVLVTRQRVWIGKWIDGELITHFLSLSMTLQPFGL